MSFEERLNIERARRIKRIHNNIDKYILNRTQDISKLEKKLINAVRNGKESVTLFSIPQKSWWYGWDELDLDHVSKTIHNINSKLNGMFIMVFRRGYIGKYRSGYYVQLYSSNKK